MASCNILDFGLIQEYYLNNISDADIANPTTVNLCCYSSLPMTYDTFVTGVETLYNNQCLRDREFSDYITKLYTQCLSGAATSHTHTETYWSANTDGSISNSGLTNTKVGVGTHTPTEMLNISGASISDNPIRIQTVQDGRGYILVIDDTGLVYKSNTASGDTVGYWTGNTDGSISNSGLTSTNVGIGTHVPAEMLHVSGNTDISDSLYVNTTAGVSGNTYVGGVLGVSGKTYFDADVHVRSSTRIYFGYDDDTQTSIRETSDNLRIEADDDILLYPDDDVKIGKESTQYAVFDGGTASLIVGTNTVPTSRLTLYKSEQTTNFSELMHMEGCSAHGIYEDMVSTQESGMKLLFGETTLIEAADTHTFVIFPTPAELPNENYSGDIVLGAYTANADCAEEVLRIDGTSLMVGIKNKTPAYDLDVTGTFHATSNAVIGGTATISTINAAGAGYTGDKILVSDGGVVEFLTTAQLSDDLSTDSYWSANTDGSISNSGLTYNAVGIGTTTPRAFFEVKDYIMFPAGAATFIGSNAGLTWSANSNTTYITALGLGACGGIGVLDNAEYNVGIGNSALAHLTSGQANTGVGSGAVQGISSGSDNIGLGQYTCFGIADNNKNIAIGNLAINRTASAGNGEGLGDTNNIAIGHRSQEIAYFNRQNTSIGDYSLEGSSFSLGTSGNTAVGFMSMSNPGSITQFRGSFNTAIGAGTLSAFTSGADYNVAVGYQAGVNITSGGKNICIGNSAQVASATANYQMNIGDIIYGNDEYSDNAISQVGIGYNDPKTKLDVHHSGNDLVSMAVDTGGGEVIYFGLNDDGGDNAMSPGKLMFLDNDFYWKYADANDVALGGSQLLAIALGTAVSDGLLIRGFFHLNAEEIEGTYDEGLPCYVSEAAGSTDFTAPTAESAFVRVVGYAISLTSDSPRLIYFTPDNTWVELS